MKVSLLRANQTVIIEQQRSKSNKTQTRIRHYDNTYLTTLPTENTTDKSAEWLADYVLNEILQQPDYYNLSLVCDDISGIWTIKFTVNEFIKPEFVQIDVDTDDIERYIKA